MENAWVYKRFLFLDKKHVLVRPPTQEACNFWTVCPISNINNLTGALLQYQSYGTGLIRTRSAVIAFVFLLFSVKGVIERIIHFYEERVGNI